MKALKVSYSRLISKGNYENAKIEIELEVEEGEKAADVFEAAKAFVEKRVAVEKLSNFTIERARKVMDDKRNHTLAQIEEAEEILAKAKVDDELPFQVVRQCLPIILALGLISMKSNEDLKTMAKILKIAFPADPYPCDGTSVFYQAYKKIMVWEGELARQIYLFTLLVKQRNTISYKLKI